MRILFLMLCMSLCCCNAGPVTETDCGIAVAGYYAAGNTWVLGGNQCSPISESDAVVLCERMFSDFQGTRCDAPWRDYIEAMIADPVGCGLFGGC